MKIISSNTCVGWMSFLAWRSHGHIFVIAQELPSQCPCNFAGTSLAPCFFAERQMTLTYFCLFLGYAHELPIKFHCSSAKEKSYSEILFRKGTIDIDLLFMVTTD